MIIYHKIIIFNNFVKFKLIYFKNVLENNCLFRWMIYQWMIHIIKIIKSITNKNT